MPVPLLLSTLALVVADKPAGLASVAERDPAQDNLRARLESQLGARLWPVHRLDKAASGAIVFARTAAAHRELSLAFEQRRVRKTYAALVHGVPAAERGSIDAPLRQFGSGRVGVDRERGKQCLTVWRVLRRLPVREPAFALLDVQPVTGRRHQIRVHLHSVGHSIVGDPLYGDTARQAGVARLMLHAQRLELPPPEADRSANPAAEGVVVESPPSADFEDVLAAIESGLPRVGGDGKPVR